MHGSNHVHMYVGTCYTYIHTYNTHTYIHVQTNICTNITCCARAGFGFGDRNHGTSNIAHWLHGEVSLQLPTTVFPIYVQNFKHIQCNAMGCVYTYMCLCACLCVHVYMCVSVLGSAEKRIFPTTVGNIIIQNLYSMYECI